jgi:predicted metal-dependent hydrolase
MSTNEKAIKVAGISISVVRKDIKNLHLGVYPPAGRVRVAAPLRISDEAVRLAVIDKLAWIRLQRSKFEQQPRQSRRELATGESHYVFGRRCRLRLRETTDRPSIKTRGVAALDMCVRPGTTLEQREDLLARWYREQLKAVIAPMVAKWSVTLAVQPTAWGVKRMKTKWGSCTPTTRRLWFNTELAKKPIDCIEYIVVHELMHLLAEKHGERFNALMDRYLPRWPSKRKRLNAAHLGYEQWDY